MVEVKREDISEKEEALEELRQYLGGLALFFIQNRSPEQIWMINGLGRHIIRCAKPFMNIDEIVIPINQREAVNIRGDDCKEGDRLTICTLSEVMNVYYKEVDRQIEGTDVLRGIAQMAESATFGT